MFDSHAHYCFPEFDKDREQVISETKKHIRGVLVSSARYDEGVCVLGLVKKHPGFLWASIGCHPMEETRVQEVIRLIRTHDDQITAIGEVGLDYHWEQDSQKRALQKERFLPFIALARELRKPLVIHSWAAEEDCFDLVKNAGISAVFHCFTGKKSLAMDIAASGLFVSISTAVFFSKNVKQTAKSIPIDRLLLETDSPFLDPDRVRKRNVPEHILLSAKKIAEIRGVTTEKILSAAWENAQEVFSLPKRS